MSPLLLVAMLLALGAVLLLLTESRKEEKRLRGRALAVSSQLAQSGDEIEPTIITPARPRESVVRRVGVWLGLVDSRLDTRRIPVPVLVAVALGGGAASSWQGMVLFGLPGLVVGPLLAVLVLRGAYTWELGLSRDRIFRQIPDAVGLMVRAVRAGLPVGEAVRSVAREMPEPTRSEFQRVLAEVGIGVPLDRALWSIHERTQLREYAFLSVVIGLQAQTGGSLAEALDNLGNIVRQRTQMALKARALASQARASAMILLALPPVGGLIMALTQEGYTDILFFEQRGLKLLGIAVGMMLIGTLVIRGMLRQAATE